ncbi:hypothetical protein ANCCAN_10431 [Ancylostoma caninum]|uniref:Uncharacterized protein n=1 Tax=Ancylostoma caninum TaxID=29170 RepID=A0A368GIR9_ANCCA|nr:hypothetical protein ANCCAN_10431 [Ancylostoma caninum]
MIHVEFDRSRFLCVDRRKQLMCADTCRRRWASTESPAMKRLNSNWVSIQMSLPVAKVYLWWRLALICPNPISCFEDETTKAERT